ncbi:MAG: hypothetical protein GWO24_19200 [Akkermansiaceae bacterium]|nr:hypothetical protein [Akkermansiaceae bacterium]
MKIPDSHPVVLSLVTYAVEMARPDRSQLPLFEERPCSVPGCDNPAGDESGLCLAHEPDPTEKTDPEPDDIPPHCSVEDCYLPATKKTGMCRAHNKANREGKALEAAKKNGPKAAAAAEEGGKQAEGSTAELVCDWPGCDRPACRDSVWCEEHYRPEILGKCRVSNCRRKPVAHGLCETHHCSNPGCENIASASGSGACYECEK